jgi:murein DD-endopeptidase MepM/ murein hydrolase activator NlpD
VPDPGRGLRRRTHAAAGQTGDTSVVPRARQARTGAVAGTGAAAKGRGAGARRTADRGPTGPRSGRPPARAGALPRSGAIGWGRLRGRSRPGGEHGHRRAGPPRRRAGGSGKPGSLAKLSPTGVLTRDTSGGVAGASASAGGSTHLYGGAGRRRRSLGRPVGDDREDAGKKRRRRRLTLLPLVALVVVIVVPVALGALGLGILGDEGTLSPQQVESRVGSVDGIPSRVVAAYQRAGGRCPGLDWSLLASVGEVESGHGQTRGASADTVTGEVRPWIFGPRLDGRNGTAAMPIGRWSGWWGLADRWLQAVGPMQFLPATFERYAVDADGDGARNPHDIDDAVSSAANNLCTAGGEEIDGPAEIARIYNPGSSSYAGELATAQRRILAASRSSEPSAGNRGETVCPVAGRVDFTDTFGAPRSGGRRHQGVDIFAPTGTPVVAPVDGTVEHGSNELGGLVYNLAADDGTSYYGAHLSAHANVGAGRVTAGTVIGYVGQTGNAAATPPHLHWEIHPGGRSAPAINPTPTADALCR